MNGIARDLDALKALVGAQNPAELQKALTTATGFVGYNLEPTAKLMLPLFAGIRNRITTDTPTQGATSATWKMMLGYGSFGFGASFGTAFAGVGNPTTPTSVAVSATYKTQAIKGQVEFEAIPMSRGYDDPLAIETSLALSSLIRLEELLVLGGNQAALDAPAPVGQASSLTTANTFAAGDWTVKVTALTLQGTLTNAAANSNVGESAVGAVDITVGVGDADFLDVRWPAVPGAVGYKVYCNSAVADNAATVYLVPVANMRYAKYSSGAIDLTALGGTITVPTGQTYVTVNRVQIVTPPANTQPAPPGADGSANANVFEGLVAWTQKNTIYSQALGTHLVKDCLGAELTTSGSGISEFDYILQNLWTSWQINPTLIITSPAGASKLTDALVAANNAAMYRLEISQERGGFTGGIFVGGYLNKFAASLMGYQPAVIPVWAHPYMPDGTYMFLTERVPYQYSREARGFALDVMTPYTYFELARTDRSFPFSTFFIETLKCYHPLAQASIVGARVA